MPHLDLSESLTPPLPWVGYLLIVRDQLSAYTFILFRSFQSLKVDIG